MAIAASPEAETVLRDGESGRVVGDIEFALRSRGLDIVYPFVIDKRLEALFPFPLFGHAACLGLLIGNTRALWPRFLDWNAAKPERDDPLDAYVEGAVAEALAARRHAVFYTQRREARAGAPAALPFQRLGREIGFAALGPAHLSVHPVFGPWFAFRAVVVLDLPVNAAEAKPAARIAPCAGCSEPCVKALDEALAASPDHAERGLGRADISAHWRRWVAVRDACPEGRAHRYPELQIKYHYTKDKSCLWRSG